MANHPDVGRIVAVGGYGTAGARWMYVTRVIVDGKQITYRGRLWKARKKEWGLSQSWNVPAYKTPRVPKPRVPWKCGGVEIVHEGRSIWRLWIDGVAVCAYPTKREATEAARREMEG